MSATIGDLVYWIRGNSEKLPGDLDKSKTQVQSFGQQISSNLKQQMNFAAGQVMAQGMTTLTTGLKNFATDVIETSKIYAEQIDDLSRKTGASLEDTSRLYNVADDLRIEYNDLSNAMTMYAKTLKDTGSTEQVSIETMARLSEEYMKLPEGVARTNYALEHFGKGGAEMMKLLEVGPDKLREMSDGVSDFALVTEDSLQASEEYRLALDDWDDSIRDLKLAFAKELLPALTSFISFLVDTAIPALRAVIDVFKSLPEPVKGAIIALGGLLTVLMSLTPVFMSIGGLINMIGGAGGVTAIFAALKGALAGLGGIVGAISLPVVALIGAIGLLVVVLKNFGPQARESLVMIGAILSTLAGRLATSVKNWFASVGVGIIRGIGDGISSGWNWLTTLVSNVAKSLLTSAKRALGIRSPSKAFEDEVGKQSALGIGKGFTDNLRTVTGSMRNGLQAMPASVLGGAGGHVSVGHIEYHGSFSEAEMNRLDKRSRNIAGNTLMEALA